MKQKLFFLAALILQLTAIAQNRIKFESNNQIGLLSGTSRNVLQLQTVNGIRYKTFFVGAGIGVDNYYFKTIPLFADIRKNIFERNQTPFVYVDAGTNFPGRKDESTTWKSTSYQPGLYYDVGVGYKWKIIKKLSVNASFGFSQKEYKSHEEYLYMSDPLGMPGIPPDRYYYRLQRFTMKFGLSL